MRIPLDSGWIAWIGGCWAYRRSYEMVRRNCKDLLLTRCNGVLRIRGGKHLRGFFEILTAICFCYS